jgi:type I restriction enzyme S subunit
MTLKIERLLKNLVISPITYGVVKPGDSDNANGIKLIRGGDILQGKINKNLRTITHEISKQYQRTILQGGELLVSLVGNPGEVAIVTKELIGANLARQVGLVRLTEEINSTFTLYYLMFTTQAIISKVTGSVQKVINLEDLQKVIIKYPSLPEQTKIANFLTAIDEKITTNQTQLNAVKQYKQGLLQQMFV